MPEFEINISWSGYSRGLSKYLVEADTEEEAKEIYYEGKKVYHEVVRDDTDSEIT